MKKNSTIFKEKYGYLKEMFEETDPVGFGAVGEYDDVIFKIIKENKSVTDPVFLFQRMVKILSTELGSSADKSLCKTISFNFLNRYPEGM